MIKTESRMKAYLGLVEGIKQHSKLILTLKNLWGMVIFRTILVTGTEVRFFRLFVDVMSNVA